MNKVRGERMTKELSAFAVSATPFDERGLLDEASLRQHLRRMLEAGVDGVYMGAPGAGESFSMTPDERDRMLAIAVEELKGKIGVRAMGWEPRLTGEMVDFVRRCEIIKPDAVLIYMLDMGHGVKPTSEEMESYYSTVIDSTSLPIVISVIPGLVGYNFPFNLLERLIDRYSSIEGIAYGGTDLNYLSDLIRRLGDRVEVHCAGESNALNVLYLGGNGFEGHMANFAPQLFVSILSAFRAKDDKRLSEAFSKLMALDGLVGGYGGHSSMRAMKPLMNAFGLPGGGTVRSPRLPVSPAELDKIVNGVLRLELPGIPAARVKD